MTVKYSVSVYLHSLKSSKRSKADFTVGNIYFWLTIFRNDRVLLSCTVGPSFRNWIYEVVFNMFLSVEGENPLLELEKRRQVQRLMNNSWRKTKCINAARLAQLVEHWSAEREVVASTPAEPTTRVFKKLHGEIMLVVIQDLVSVKMIASLGGDVKPLALSWNASYHTSDWLKQQKLRKLHKGIYTCIFILTFEPTSM